MPALQEAGQNCFGAYINGLEAYSMRKMSLSTNANNLSGTTPDSGGWRGGRSIAGKTFRKKSGFGLSFDLDSISESIQGKFYNTDLAGSDDGSGIPLITKLDKYTNAELREYRQVFNMFDAG